MSMSKRDEVLDELVKFLKARNKQKRELSDWLKHPFILMFVGTLLGTLAVAYLTHLWTGDEQRNLLALQFQRSIIEQQYNLLEKVSLHYHKSANHLNSWFQFLIAVADESIKPDSERNKRRYDFCLKEGQEAEKNYRIQEPFGAKLDQVKVVFMTDEVKNAADSLDNKWTLFVEKVHLSVRHYNSGKVKKNDLIEWQKFRKDTIDEIETMKKQLAEQMGNEISTAYKNQL